MRLEKCYFCSSTMYPGRGVQFVRLDCKVFRFCRAKCQRNFKMKRNPRKIRWTKAFRKAHGKELTADSTMEFERRRHRPVKYDRNLMAATIRAIQRVAEIKAARESRHYQNRMKGNKLREKQSALRDLKQNIELLKVPQLNADRRQLLNRLKETAKLNRREEEKNSSEVAMEVQTPFKMPESSNFNPGKSTSAEKVKESAPRATRTRKSAK